MKVSKKDERLARALTMNSILSTGNGLLAKALGTDEIIRRVDTMWGDCLDEAKNLNECLRMVAHDALDGHLTDITTSRDMDE